MRHPFLNSTRLVLFYFSFWVILSFFLAFVRWYGHDIIFGNALIFSIVLIFSYAIIGTSIWFVIQHNSFETKEWYKLIIYHIIAASIITAFWLYFTSVVLKLFVPYPKQQLFGSLPTRAFIGYLMYTIFAVFFYAVSYYQNFKEKVKNEGELKALVKEAELHALKSQINPHFLFNSLNSISSLTMSDPEKAQEMVINLSSLMRYSLKHNQNEKVKFSEELENNKLYLGIEKVRFGKKLNPIFDIDENCLKALIPNMILQPLYENAIKYGVYETTEPVDVVTRCKCNEKFLEITISNTYDPNVINKKGEGIGLRNIKERLQIIFGNPGLIRIVDNNEQFTVYLTIPQN